MRNNHRLLLIVFTNPIRCQSRRNLTLVLKSQVKEKKGKEKIYYGHLHNLHFFITFSNLSPVLFFFLFFLTRKNAKRKDIHLLVFWRKAEWRRLEELPNWWSSGLKMTLKECAKYYWLHTWLLHDKPFHAPASKNASTTPIKSTLKLVNMLSLRVVCFKMMKIQLGKVEKSSYRY